MRGERRGGRSHSLERRLPEGRTERRNRFMSGIVMGLEREKKNRRESGSEASGAKDGRSGLVASR